MRRVHHPFLRPRSRAQHPGKAPQQAGQPKASTSKVADPEPAPETKPTIGEKRARDKAEDVKPSKKAKKLKIEVKAEL